MQLIWVLPVVSSEGATSSLPLLAVAPPRADVPSTSSRRGKAPPIDSFIGKVFDDYLPSIV